MVTSSGLKPKDFVIGRYYQWRNAADTIWAGPAMHRSGIRWDGRSPGYRETDEWGNPVVSMTLEGGISFSISLEEPGKASAKRKDPYAKGPNGETLGPSGLKWL